MRFITLIIISVFLLSSCSQDKISYNPFKTNEKIKLKTVLDNCFEVSFIEDITCYEYKSDSCQMFFYYDNDKNEIIGEGYYLFIDSITNPTDSIYEKILNLELEHDLQTAQKKIEVALEQFNGSIISIFSFTGDTKDLTFFARDSIFNRIIQCDLIYTTDFKEAIYIENFYSKQ